MAETTSTEFVTWQRYFEEDLKYPTKEDYYLAQIAAECRRWMSKNPDTVKVEQFLMKFSTWGSTPKKLTEEELQERTKNSKARWAAILHKKGKDHANGD